MTNTNIVSPGAATTAPLASADPASIRALGIAAGVVDIAGIWQKLMTTTVIDVVPILDKADAFSFPKRLLTEKAKAVLTIIWVNSDFFTDEEVIAAGYKRLGSPTSPLNCHKVAKTFAPLSSNLDSEEKAVQKIIDAAVAYGLVAKHRFNNSNMWVLRGTQDLHRLMLANCTNCHDVCVEVAALGPEVA